VLLVVDGTLETRIRLRHASVLFVNICDAQLDRMGPQKTKRF